MSNFDKLKLLPKVKISKGSNKQGPFNVKSERREYGVEGTYDIYDKGNTKITISGDYKKSSGRDRVKYKDQERIFEGESDPSYNFGIKITKKFKRGGDVMPRRNKKNFRPTEKGAGMTKAGVAAYRRANPGSKLQTAVTGKVKPGSKAAKRRKSYCARSLGQLKRASAKTRNDPNSRIRQARRRWKC
jgi:hypothetical protein